MALEDKNADTTCRVPTEDFKTLQTGLVWWMMTAIIKAIQSHRRQIRNIVLILLGLGAFVIIGLIAIVLLIVSAFSNVENMYSNPACASPSGIENLTYIELPPSMANLQSGCGGMQGIMAWAFFDMKPSDLDVFINSTKVKLPLSTTDKPEKLKCISCGESSELKSYLYGIYSGNEWFEEIFIDTSNSAQWRVYFTLLAG
jgi:hypothetical protein